MSHYTIIYKYGKRARSFWGRFNFYFMLVFYWGHFQ